MTKIALLTSVLSLTAFGCVAEEDDPQPNEVPASAEPVAVAFTQGAGIVVGVGASLASTGNGISDDATEEEAKGDIEDGVGGEGDNNRNAAPNGVPDFATLSRSLALENPECVTLTWVGLTATITYNQCINSDGATINGAITLGLQLIPLRFFVAFDQLTVDTVSYDGEIGLAFTGPVGMRSVSLDADFSYNDGTQNELDLSNLSIAVNQVTGGTNVVVNGSGSVVTPEVSATVQAGGITWDGECLPTSGSLAYNSGLTAATITFLETTPVDGEVIVSVGSFTTQTQLLPPCP